MDAAELSAEDFFKRWKQIGGAPREAQRIFGLVNKNRTMSMEFVRRVVHGFKWGILDGVDPNPKNLVGATVLHTTDGKFGCLLRLEPNLDTQVRVLLRSAITTLTFTDVPYHHSRNRRRRSAYSHQSHGGALVAGHRGRIVVTRRKHPF